MNRNDNSFLYMRRCLQLATYGRGFVAPNPMVGAVIVHNNRIVGEGFHGKYGGPHAEVQAVASVKDEKFLKNSTLYVNLEPCSHYGKTPPCVDLIREKQIPRVVVGQEDPFPEVSGRGIKILREAGIEVICGILEEECRELNKRFLIYTLQHRPYIILKWAQSSDGFMDQLREENDGKKPIKFSNDFTQMLVHKTRAEESAIMVGTQTLRLDKPALNVRYWKGNDPKKITADSRQSLRQQIYALYDRNIQSLMVEGGAKLLQSFLNENLWDEVQIEVAAFPLTKGVVAPVPKGILQNVQKCENSVLFHYRNGSNS
ncbi:MAG: bifunctional diaminohydroxyphosphoribosylaminopyrimidine deaminase/5-amino-6-(5-phosphoribosylamino)uracil reductase RibD [Candidatus Azobacteroides sp.]|nr:bifunctional diaminohydroxyphosphoribosylaminopyrimidine deaminase/5-amino-6-(5-phosphoribosylamino)uracil reductase RibD [Candidatus Azobacteroides sp.]